MDKSKPQISHEIEDRAFKKNIAFNLFVLLDHKVNENKNLPFVFYQIADAQFNSYHLSEASYSKHSH